MKNHQGAIATLLTLGLVIVGTLITLGTSLFVSNKNTNLASNPRAAEICTTGFYALEGNPLVSGSGCAPVCGSDCEECNWNGKTKWQCKTAATGGSGVPACTKARTYASLINCKNDPESDDDNKCTQCLVDQTNRVEYDGSGPPAGGSATSTPVPAQTCRVYIDGEHFDYEQGDHYCINRFLMWCDNGEKKLVKTCGVSCVEKNKGKAECSTGVTPTLNPTPLPTLDPETTLTPDPIPTLTPTLSAVPGKCTPATCQIPNQSVSYSYIVSGFQTNYFEGLDCDTTKSASSKADIENNYCNNQARSITANFTINIDPNKITNARLNSQYFLLVYGDESQFLAENNIKSAQEIVTFNFSSKKYNSYVGVFCYETTKLDYLACLNVDKCVPPYIRECINVTQPYTGNNELNFNIDNTK